MMGNFPSVANITLTMHYETEEIRGGGILSTVQLCRQGGNDLVSPEVSSHSLLLDFKPLKSEPLKD